MGIMVVSASLGLLAASCSSGASSSLDVEFISIAQYANRTTGAECNGDEEGTSVIVKDGDGAIVGTGRVGPGRWEEHPDGFNHDCVHRATVDLDEAGFYVVSVEGLGGELTYTHDELASSDWAIAIG